MQNGERVDGIEKDPLLDIASDISYDYNIVPGFLQREQSMSGGDDKLRIQPHPESLKHVEKMLKKAKEIKEHHAHDSKTLDDIKEESEIARDSIVEGTSDNLVESEIVIEDHVPKIEEIVQAHVEEHQVEEVKPVESVEEIQANHEEEKLFEELQPTEITEAKAEVEDEKKEEPIVEKPEEGSPT